MADPIIQDDSISGNKVHGGVISEFQSTGIQDLATQTSLVVSNGTATVDRIRTKTLDGNVVVNGNMELTGSINIAENVNFQKDLSIDGNIKANTITVQNLIANVKQETREPLTFVGMSPTDLTGKGLVWRVGGQVSSVVYKNGKLAFSLEPDLALNQSYHVAGAAVLSQDALGPTVTRSNLKELGRLKQLTVDGKTEINGATDFTRDVSVDGNVKITGTLEAQTIKASQVITENGGAFELGNFTADSEGQLNGQGIHWLTDTADFMLTYRTGARLWTNASMDLGANSSYKIDDTDVLTIGELGRTVAKSNLREVGQLKNLTVLGDTHLAGFAAFNGTLGRLGINTENPNSALSVVENDVEVMIGAYRPNVGHIGTHSSDDLALVTDNTTRITLKNNGQVIFGNETTRNADVRIYGTLQVDTVVSDSRIDRYSPLEFKASKDQEIYGQGLQWTGTGSMRQFVMRASPDRLWSTESIELSEEKSFYIGGVPVLSSKGIGSTVTQSNLSKLGTLEDLNVDGEATFFSRINASRAVINAKTIVFNDGDEFVISNSTLSASRNFSIVANGSESFYADQQQIAIGNKDHANRAVKVFGQVSIGVNNPDTDVDLSVKGNIKFADKKFVTGNSAPTQGTFSKGDICWNSNPTPSNYVGWVCMESGAPGAWLPFGLITPQ
jgi:cytoskeletal protein CcmA (bactofilin family)